MKYWYRLTTHACPICGSEHRYRERMYTPKPEDAAERYQYIEIYDWCSG